MSFKNSRVVVPVIVVDAMKNEEERLRYIGRFVPPTFTTSVLEAVAVFIAISPGRLAEGLEA